METRHFIKTICKQKVKTFFLSTLIALKPKWVQRFNDFIFSITHSRYNQKIITHMLHIVFITRSHIFLSEIQLKFVMEFLVLIFFIGRWLVGRWSVHLVGGRLVGGKWSVG